MAHKQNIKKAVKKLFQGQIDPHSKLGGEILQEITERVFKDLNANAVLDRPICAA
jgi:hypothetical protein